MSRVSRTLLEHIGVIKARVERIDMTRVTIQRVIEVSDEPPLPLEESPLKLPEPVREPVLVPVKDNQWRSQPTRRV